MKKFRATDSDDNWHNEQVNSEISKAARIENITVDSIQNALHMREDLQYIVKEAGKIALEYFHQWFDVETKSNAHDYVTTADIAVNKYITDDLHRRFPDIPVVSEEGDVSLTDWSWPVWVIDPIDGTYEFVHHLDSRTILLGMAKDWIPHIWLMYFPVIDELYIAEAGKWCYKIVGSNAELISFPSGPKNTKVAYGVQLSKYFSWGQLEYVWKKGWSSTNENVFKELLLGKIWASFWPFPGWWPRDRCAPSVIIQEAWWDFSDRKWNSLDFKIKWNNLWRVCANSDTKLQSVVKLIRPLMIDKREDLKTHIDDARVKKQELISSIKTAKDKSEVDISQWTMENKQLENFFLHKPTDEIVKTVEIFSWLIRDTLWKDLNSIDKWYKKFRKQAIIASSKIRNEKINYGLLEHIKTVIMAFNYLEEMIKSSHRFSEEEIALAKKQSLLHDMWRLISHHPVLHEKFEEYRGAANYTKEGKKIESGYENFDPKKAKELATISALFSLIDSFAKPDDELGVKNPLKFFEITDQEKDQNISDTLPKILERRPRSKEKNPREDKLKLSLLLVLKDLSKNFPNFGIKTRKDLEEKIVRPIGKEVQKINAKEFFGLED